MGSDYAMKIANVKTKEVQDFLDKTFQPEGPRAGNLAWESCITSRIWDQPIPELPIVSSKLRPSLGGLRGKPDWHPCCSSYGRRETRLGLTTREALL